MVLRSVLPSCRELAGRRFRKTGFAFAVILALALGVGANTATLSLLYGYSLAPLPYPQAGRLVHVFIASKAYPGHTLGLGYDTYAALKAGLNGMAAAGLFSLLYGCFRFLVEFVRMPDEQLGCLAWGWVTMGQILSVPLIIAGIVLLVLAYRRKEFAGAAA